MKSILDNVYFSLILSMNSILYLKIFTVTVNAFAFMLLSLMLLDPSIGGMLIVLLKCPTLWTWVFTNTCPLWNTYFSCRKKVLYREK